MLAEHKISFIDIRKPKCSLIKLQEDNDSGCRDGDDNEEDMC